MAEITLVAEPGRPTGSASSRRLRAAGRIPAVVYGHGGAGTAVSVDGRDLRHALSGEAGLNQLLSLRVGSDTHLALARAIQRHPVRHTVLHVDFLVVRRDEVISAEVPILLVGEARAVEMEKGLVEQLLTALTVNATPARIPTHLEVDISDLTVGSGVRVGDLPLPTGVTTDIPADELIVVAQLSRAALELEAEEEAAAAEAEEGAQAGAEGEAGESGAAGGDRSSASGPAVRSDQPGEG
jgi:large subunit ribosomal protein L25